MLAKCFSLFGKTNRGGRSWSLNRRPHGDSAMTCLGIIIAVIALGIGGYYYFWHNRALERAGEDITIVNKTDDSSINSYRLRVRDRLIPKMITINTNARKACKTVYSGKGDQEEAIKELDKCDGEMREFITDVNDTNCPTKFSSMQKHIAVCCGCDWKAVTLAKKALKASEEPLKKQHIEESKKELAKGNKAFQAAKMDAEGMFKK